MFLRALLIHFSVRRLTRDREAAIIAAAAEVAPSDDGPAPAHLTPTQLALLLSKGRD